MIAEAFESVKRRYFGRSAPASPVPDDAPPERDAGTMGPDEPPFRLTPNEEILRLVEAHGGRIEQGDVVAALEWSPATVSRRLGDLESDGRVVRYPVGRRKIVCLPGCEPSAVGSPYEA